MPSLCPSAISLSDAYSPLIKKLVSILLGFISLYVTVKLSILEGRSDQINLAEPSIFLKIPPADSTDSAL